MSSQLTALTWPWVHTSSINSKHISACDFDLHVFDRWSEVTTTGPLFLSLALKLIVLLFPRTCLTGVHRSDAPVKYFISGVLKHVLRFNCTHQLDRCHHRTCFHALGRFHVVSPHIIDRWSPFHITGQYFSRPINKRCEFVKLIFNWSNAVDGCRREWRILRLCWSTVKLLASCLLVKMKDFSFIMHTVLRKDLVWGGAMLSGTLATMRWPFESLFAVVKVFVKRSTWIGRISSGGHKV